MNCIATQRKHCKRQLRAIARSGNRIPVQKYQLCNNIESATLELDENASIISYEEYYPYGDTSYQAGRNASEVSQKRYRYTGKEKDEESGLYYHGARYYACWLGRWTASDPIGVGDGVNLYAYCSGNPVKLVDPGGTKGGNGLYEDIDISASGGSGLYEDVEVKGSGSGTSENLEVNEPDSLGGTRGWATGSIEKEISPADENASLQSSDSLSYSEWSEVDWLAFYSSVAYNKSSRITLDESGEKIFNLEAIDDGRSVTEIYSFSGELLHSLREAKAENHYNDPSNVGKILEAKFLGDITPQAEQYIESFHRSFPIGDLLRSGTNAKFDFKGTKRINEDPNSVVILAGHVMTLRDAGNFLFGYSANFRYPRKLIAWGGGFDEKNKRPLKKVTGLPGGIFSSKYRPPYYGEEPRSANMALYGMSLFAPKE